MSANGERGRGEPSVSFTAWDRHRPDIYRPRADLITEDTRQKHTTSSHFTSLHPQLHHHRSSFTDNFTDLKADHKTKERRERSLPALILRAPQLVTYSTGEPRNPHNSRLIKDLTHGWRIVRSKKVEARCLSRRQKRQRGRNESKLNGS